MNDGGPAFPNRDDKFDHHDGLTLRDYFAAGAMAALVSDGQCVASNEKKHGIIETLKGMATIAYGAADAMLAERAKP